MLAFDGISQFHLAVPQLVFGLGTLPRPKTRYDVSVCIGGTRRDLRGRRPHVACPRRARFLQNADVVVVPSWRPPSLPSPEVSAALRRAHDRGALVIGLCLGSWVVADGIVDGRAVATHWDAADALARRFRRSSCSPTCCGATSATS